MPRRFLSPEERIARAERRNARQHAPRPVLSEVRSSKGVLVVPGIRARFRSTRRPSSIEFVHEESGQVVPASNSPCTLKLAAETAREVFRAADVDGVKYPLAPEGSGDDWPEHVKKAWLAASRASMNACSDHYYKLRFPPGSRHRTRDSWR